MTYQTMLPHFNAELFTRENIASNNNDNVLINIICPVTYLTKYHQRYNNNIIDLVPIVVTV